MVNAEHLWRSLWFVGSFTFEMGAVLDDMILIDLVLWSHKFQVIDLRYARAESLDVRSTHHHLKTLDLFPQSNSHSSANINDALIIGDLKEES